MAYHGTITKRLGVDLAIKAVALLSKEIPNLEFHIWGGGDYLNECIRISANLGIKEKIRFNGTHSIEDLVKKLNEMDIGIIPNRKSMGTELMLPVKLFRGWLTLQNQTESIQLNSQEAILQTELII